MTASKRQLSLMLSTGLVLFILSSLLTSYSVKNPWLGRLGWAISAEILRPIQILRRDFAGTCAYYWENYFNLLGVHAENIELKKRLFVIESENSVLRELEHENKRLQGLLSVQNELKKQGVVANVVAFEPSSWVQALSIDKGALAGLRPGMAVLSGKGVVGQLVAVGRSTSRVLLVSDPSSGIDSIIQESRIRGVMEGIGRFKSRWNYVASEAEVQIGNRILTSGLDGVFPRGLMLGTIKKVADRDEGALFQEIDVELAVDFSKLETVLIVDAKIDKDYLLTNANIVENSANEDKAVSNISSEDLQNTENINENITNSRKIINPESNLKNTNKNKSTKKKIGVSRESN